MFWQSPLDAVSDTKFRTIVAIFWNTTNHAFMVAILIMVTRLPYEK